MAAPTLADFTQYRGALTKSGAGAVAMSAIMLSSDGGQTISAWAITLTGGTAGHWTTPTDGTSPAPTTAGVAAGLSGGPYTFSATATNAAGTSAAKTLTINIRANTYTVSTALQITNSSTGVRANRGTLGGKTIEFARGSDANYVGNVINFLAFNTHTVGTRFNVTSEDATNPTTVWCIGGYATERADFYDFNCSATLASNNTSTDNQLNTCMFSLTYSSSFGVSQDITVTRVNMSSAAGSAANQWTTGFYFVGGAGTGPVTNTITISACRMTRTYNACRVTNASDVTVSNCVIDSFCANAFTWGSRMTNTVSRDNIVVRAFNNPIAPGNHCDFDQVQSTTDANCTGNVRQRNFYSIANGDNPAQCPNYYDDIASTTGGADSGFRLNGTIVDGAFCDSPAANGFHFEAGSGWDVRHVTGVRGYLSSALIGIGGANPSGPTWSVPEHGLTASGAVVDCVMLRAGTSLATQFPSIQTLNTFFVDTSAAPGTWTEAARAAYFTPWFQNPGHVRDFSAMTAEQVVAALKADWAPILNGSLKNANGTYRGALFPDGTWNDGTVYNLTPPTLYTSSAAVAGGAVGAPITITLQLDAAANQAVTITPHVAGVTGTFSSATVVIDVGAASITIDFTPTSAGAASVTFTNDRSLPNPAALPLTITAAPTGPTLYTQVALPALTPIGQGITITYVLDAPATADVTITPGCTLAGSFVTGSTVVIPFGIQSGSATFVASTIGTATFSATNNRSLSNPATTNVTVVRTTVGQLIRQHMRRKSP